MNKKFLVGAGTLALAVAAVFVGRASAKFAKATNVYYTVNGSTCTTLLTSNPAAQFTTGGTHTQATIGTANGSGIANLYSTSNCGSTKKVYFKP